MHRDLFFGPVVVDFRMLTAQSLQQLLTANAPAKLDSTIAICLGGAVSHSSDVFQHLVGERALVLPVLADDPLSQVAKGLLGGTSDVEGVTAADSTRMSFILPRGDKPGVSITITSRPNIDLAAAYDAISPHLAAARTLFLGSFDARHVGLLERVLDRFQGTSYLMATRSQLQDRERTLALMKRVTFTQMNSAELREHTGQELIVDGIDQLRSKGCESVIVTDGAGGVTAFTKGHMWFASSLDVPVESDIGGGDAVGGAICAGEARDEYFGDTLYCAMAAAAMKVSNNCTSMSWDELLKFYDETPHLPHGIVEPAHTVSRMATTASPRPLRCSPSVSSRGTY